MRNEFRARQTCWVGLLTLFLFIHPESTWADPANYGGANEPAPARRAELLNLIRQDCGSCHGLTLAGGLGPPLSVQALADKPVEYIEAMILRGRPGTAMPGWKGLLSDDEARWIAQELKRGFAR